MQMQMQIGVAHLSLRLILVTGLQYLLSELLHFVFIVQYLLM